MEMTNYCKMIGHYGDDSTITAAARMSFNTGKTYPKEEDEKLIKTMIEKGHTSPFEQVNFTFQLRMPIFIARQWMRHRTARLNEQSGRYTMLKNEFFFPNEWRTSKGGELDEETVLELTGDLEEFYNSAYLLYSSFISYGLSKELARTVLPLGTYTEFIWQMDLHNLMHFLELRLAKGAQLEIREYAEEVLRQVEEVCPITIKYFKENKERKEEGACLCELYRKIKY